MGDLLFYMEERVRQDKKKNSGTIWVPEFGAGDEARTRYLHLGKVALYQMSYARTSAGLTRR